MAHHIHVHMHDAAGWNEGAHKRQGGQFSSTGGGSAGPSGANRPSTQSMFKAKHNPGAGKGAAPAEESAQEKLDKARREKPLL